MNSPEIKVGANVRFRLGGQTLTGQLVSYTTSGKPLVRRMVKAGGSMRWKYHQPDEGTMEVLRMRIVKREESEADE